jgi:pimeloyl-ACP methyl ester carboxylesterase
MLRRWFTLLCLLALVAQSLSLPLFTLLVSADEPIGDSRPPEGVETAPHGSPIRSDDTHFVADRGGDLDQYLFRTDRPDGRLKYSIDITRYYFNLQDANSNIRFDSNGLLTSASVTHIISKKILPASVKLLMRVYDVDEDAEWCPELDLVFVNGLPLTRGGQQVRLTGANETWSVVSYDVPISMLKFPQSKGNGAAPTVGRNEIAIQIDANQCNYNGNPAWAVEVDYGIFEITGPIRPVVFAHGWNGNTGSFNWIEDHLRGEGIPSAGQADLGEGIYRIPQTAGWLNDHIRDAAMEYGVDKINLYAHSKGGLVSRWSLGDNVTAQKVEHLITFDTPHHGTVWAESEPLMIAICTYKYGLDLIKVYRCVDATKEFTRDSVRETFNYSGCTQNWFTGAWSNCLPKYVRQPGVDYRAFAAAGETVLPRASASYPWNANQAPMPSQLNVDAAYFVTHGDILELLAAYRCSIHLLDDTRYGCPGLEADATYADSDQTAMLIERTAKQVILTQAGSLVGPGQLSADVVVDGGTQLVIETYATQAISFNLVEPGGRLITPAVANADPLIDYINSVEFGLNYYSYVIANPAPGLWRAQVQSGSAVDFTVMALVDSSSTLAITTDRLSYLPGEIVTVQAALMQSGAALPGSAVSGEYEQPNGAFTPLAFYDDGTNGDPTANDGLYTARFTAPQARAKLRTNVVASRLAIRREGSTVFAVSAQTAAINAVSRSWTVDEDQNGLIDWLMIEVNVNVLQAGHFDLQGNLVDANGILVHSAQAVSRNQSANPLAPGVRPFVLAYDAQTFWQSNRNGPYVLTDLKLMDTTDHVIQVDSRNNLYTTAAYNVNQFEHPVVRLESMTETATDQNGNNLFDQLTFNVRLAFSRTGNYVFNGRLVDPNGDEIAWSGATFTVSSSGVYAVNVSFPGAQIGAHRVDGPYFLRDVSVYNQQGTAMVYLEEIGATRPYRFTQFENGFYVTSLPLLMRNFSGGGSAYSWIDATAGGAIVAQGDDTNQYVGLPFAFNFYGNTYSGLYVSSNGFVSFGSGSSSFSNGCIPSASTPNNAIYAFWDDLVPGGGSDGNVYVKQVGSDTFVIEWHGVRKFGTSNSYHTFEIVLRRDHTITLQYQSLSTTHSATVGVENGSGTLARQHICDGVGTPLSNQLAIRYMTP